MAGNNLLKLIFNNILKCINNFGSIYMNFKFQLHTRTIK